MCWLCAGYIRISDEWPRGSGAIGAYGAKARREYCVFVEGDGEQMTNRHAKQSVIRALAAFLAGVMLMGLCACARLTAVFQNETETDNEPAANEPVPTAAVLPTQTPPDETLNPLLVFYAEFDAKTHQQIADMGKALTSSGKAAQHIAKAALERMNIMIRAAHVSIGRLTYDSLGIYNGSVVGAANGSGTLQKASGDSSYTMRFSYQDGTSLYGIFTEKSIVYVMGSEARGYSCCAIVKTDEGYRIAADVSGEGAVAEISGESISLATLSFTQPVLEFDASQSDAPDLALYDPSYLNVDINSAEISSYWQLKQGKLELIGKPFQQAGTLTNEP